MAPNSHWPELWDGASSAHPDLVSVEEATVLGRPEPDWPSRVCQPAGPSVSEGEGTTDRKGSFQHSYLRIRAGQHVCVLRAAARDPRRGGPCPKQLARNIFTLLPRHEGGVVMALRRNARVVRTLCFTQVQRANGPALRDLGLSAMGLVMEIAGRHNTFVIILLVLVPLSVA